MLYWNYAAWIILRGEYKGMKKTLSENVIEKRLKERYGYMSQVNQENWFAVVQGYGNYSPLDSAHEDTAKNLGLKDGETLRRMISPGRLRKSPPGSLVIVSMDSKKLLSRLRRIPPSDRTRREKWIIRMIKFEVH